MSINVSADRSGICGNNVTWTYVEATKTLIIEGSGAMDNFSFENVRYCDDCMEVYYINDIPWSSETYRIENVIIHEGVTYIGDNAFSGCKLKSLSIPHSVTHISNLAFSGYLINNWTEPGITTCQNITIECDNISTWFAELSGLESIVLGEGTTSIAESAFARCTSLKEVTIGKNVASIGYSAFANCSSLKSVTSLIETPYWIDNSVFGYSLSSSTSLYVPKGKKQVYQSTSSWNQFPQIIELDGGEVIGIAFADKVVEAMCVANWDENNDGMFSKDEAAAVTDLGSVFANNTDITSFDELQYFTGLTSIGEQAFYYCSNLNSIIIPENVKTIGNRAFYVCSDLKSLRIPANVSNIEDRAFAYCSGLESIEVDENNQYFDSRNNCNALIQTSSNTLLVGCKNSVIPDGVTSIAEGAFRGCTELTNMVIPEGVKTIGASAFRGCTGLTSVSLPSTITSIGNYAFSAFDEVYNLTTVTVGMTSPVAIASEVFPNRANSILYVPKGSRPAYNSADYWKEFKQIIELEDGVPVKCEKPTITFFASGKIKVESATEGAKCITNISASNIEPLTDGEISLNTPLTIYTVKAYATAEGYADSDEATATFRWEKTEGDMNGDGTVNIADVIHLVNIILGN